MVFGMLLLRIFIALQQLSVIVDAGPRATTDHSSELEATDLSDAHCRLSPYRTGLTVDLKGFFALHYTHLFRLQEQQRQDSASVSHSSFLQSVWSIPPERRWRHRGWVRRLPQRRTRRWHRRRHHSIHAVSGRILITPIVQRFLHLCENEASFCGCSSRHRTLKTRSLSTTCLGWCQPQRLEHRDPHLHAVCEQHSYAGMEHLLHVSQAGLPRSQVRARNHNVVQRISLPILWLGFFKNLVLQAGALLVTGCVEVRVAPIARGAGLNKLSEILYTAGAGTHGAMMITGRYMCSLIEGISTWMAGVVRLTLCLSAVQFSFHYSQSATASRRRMMRDRSRFKSQWRHAKPWLLWWLLAFTLVPGVWSHRETVPQDSMRSQEGRSLMTQWSGPSWIRKRAYNRAVRRAQASSAQTTIYRGRVCSLQQLEARRRCIGGLRDRSSWTQGSRDRQSLICMTWNAGGLTSGTLEEFLHWIETMPSRRRPNVICIQETHWSFENSEWTSGGWHHVHSGVTGRPDRYAGILTLIKAPGLTKDSIRVRRVSQGRLDHVRFEWKSNTFDVINFYQKAVSFTQAADAYAKRASLLKHVSSLIGGLPQRNVMLMMGDFNVQLYPDHPQVGPCTTLGRDGEQISKDGEKLQELLRSHKLTVLNTWACKHPATYQHLQHRSQIDYIIMRQSQSRGPAKSARPEHRGELARWKDTRHHPVLAEVVTPTGGHRPTASKEHAWKIDTTTLRKTHDADPRLVHLQTQLRHAATDITINTYHLLPGIVGRLAQNAFPRQGEPRLAKWQEKSMTKLVDKMWWYYRCSKGRDSLDGVTLPTIFQRWHAHARFMHLRALAKAHGRTLQKQRFEEVLSQAEQAMRSGDQQALHQHVRALAPKTRRVVPQLMDEEGRLLDVKAEMTVLQSHFGQVWKQPACWKHPVLQTTPVMPDETELEPSSQEVIHAVQSIKGQKAVPSTLPPAIVWKQCAITLGALVHSITSPFWVDGSSLYPRSWHATYIILIPKAKKPIGKASSLRPIGLQDPLAKAYVAVLARHFKPHALEYLACVPQYAYLPGRDSHAAIGRAIEYCSRARDMLRAGTYNIHSRRSGLQHSSDFVAALQVSLDLSQAFDTAPWSLLEAALARTRAPRKLREAIMAWITSTRYIVCYRGQTVEVEATRGIRQGCVLSPVVWSVFTGLIYHEYQARIAADPVAPQVTMFADDDHLGWLVQRPEHLKVAVRQLNTFISVLTDFGLQVNPSKSQSILAVRGPGAERVRQQHTVWVKDAEGRQILRLRLPGHKLSEGPPLVQSIDYMGIVLSYSAFEELSMRKRLGVAQGNFDRCKKVLHNRKVLTIPQRLTLWKSIVLPAATYGILATGFTKVSLERFHGLVLRHMRSISNSPLHIHRESNWDLMVRLGQDLPVQMLQRLCAGRIEKLQARPSSSSDSHGIYASLENLLRSSSQQLEQLADKYQPPLHSAPALATENSFRCSLCDASFDTQAKLRQHESKVHTGKKKTTCLVSDHNANIRRHGKDGMPTCVHCNEVFQRWSGLNRHITLGRCTVYKPAEEGTLGTAIHSTTEPLDPVIRPVVDHDEFQQRLNTGGLQALGQASTVLEELRAHCSICRQWLAKLKDCKSHYKKSHQDLWKKYGSRAEKLVRPESLAQACLYCGAVTSHHTKHVCPVQLQARFANLVYNGRRTGCRDGGSQHGRTSDVRGPLEQTKPSEAQGRGSSGAEQATPPSARAQIIGDIQSGQAGQRSRAPERTKAATEADDESLEQGGAAGKHAGSPLFEARRRVVNDEVGSGVLPVSPHGSVSGNDHPITVPECSSMEGAATGETPRAPTSTEGGTLQPGHAGIFHEARQHHSHTGAARPGQAERDGDGSSRQTLLDLLGVRRRDKTGVRGTEPGPIGSRTTPSQSQGPTGVRRGEHYPPIPQQSPTRREDGGRHASDAAGDVHLQRGCNGPASQDQRSMPQLGLESHRRTTAPRTDAALAAGEQDSRDYGLRAIRKVILLNPDQRCYQNAVFLALAHAHVELQIQMPVPYSHVLGWVMGHARTKLADSSHWSPLIEQWPEPLRQHDAAEFLMHLLSRTAFTALDGQWSVFRGQRRVDDHSLETAPLILNIGRHKTLQAMIQAWHVDAGTNRYITVGPQILVFQLTRFLVQSGRVRKSAAKVPLATTVNMPLWGGDEQATLTYRILGGVYHLGPRAQSGHYRSFQVDETGVPGMWVTDDGSGAKRATESDEAEVRSNAYILFYARCEA